MNKEAQEIAQRRASIRAELGDAAMLVPLFNQSRQLQQRRCFAWILETLVLSNDTLTPTEIHDALHRRAKNDPRLGLPRSAGEMIRVPDVRTISNNLKQMKAFGYAKCDLTVEPKMVGPDPSYKYDLSELGHLASHTLPYVRRNIVKLIEANPLDNNSLFLQEVYDLFLKNQCYITLAEVFEESATIIFGRYGDMNRLVFQEFPDNDIVNYNARNYLEGLSDKKILSFLTTSREQAVNRIFNDLREGYLRKTGIPEEISRLNNDPEARAMYLRVNKQYRIEALKQQLSLLENEGL